MSKRIPDTDAFALVDNYDDGPSFVFNESDEEERYQAFKSRLMSEVIATGSFLEYQWGGGLSKESQELDLVERKP